MSEAGASQRSHARESVSLRNRSRGRQRLHADGRMEERVADCCLLERCGLGVGVGVENHSGHCATPLHREAIAHRAIDCVVDGLSAEQPCRQRLRQPLHASRLVSQPSVGEEGRAHERLGGGFGGIDGGGW